jgi:hypothetical protein
MTQPTCATCRFRHPVPNCQPEDGYCRRFPPQLVSLTMPRLEQSVLENHYPFVQGSEWCGEHKPVPDLKTAMAQLRASMDAPFSVHPGDMERMRDVVVDVPAQVVRQLRGQLDAAAIEVLRGGQDWVEGPIEWGDDNPFSTTSLFEPRSLSGQVRGGPAPSPDYVPPPGWRIIRHADWVAAGRPGDRSEA